MKSYTAQEAVAKIQKYCAYQERCHAEVRTKLFEYGLRSSDVDEIITNLILSGFLNEELANDPQVRKVYLGQNFELRRAKINIQDNYL